MPSVTASLLAAAEELDSELAALEHRQALIVEHVQGLRAANEALRGELAAEQAKNRALAERVREAGRRLDALLARLPEAAE